MDSWYVVPWPRYWHIRKSKATCRCAAASRSLVLPQNMLLSYNTAYRTSRWRTELHCFWSVQHLCHVTPAVTLYSRKFHLITQAMNIPRVIYAFLIRPTINFLAPEIFFLILAQPVYKMWIKQEPNTLELWNKVHFEEKKTESIYYV